MDVPSPVVDPVEQAAEAPTLCLARATYGPDGYRFQEPPLVRVTHTSPSGEVRDVDASVIFVTLDKARCFMRYHWGEGRNSQGYMPAADVCAQGKLQFGLEDPPPPATATAVGNRITALLRRLLWS